MNRDEIVLFLYENGFAENKSDRWYRREDIVKRGCTPAGILRFRFLPNVLRLEVSTRGESGTDILSWVRMWSCYYAFLTPEGLSDVLTKGVRK